MNDSGNGDNEDKGSEGGSILDDGGIDTDERAGRSLGIEPDKEPDEDTKQDIEQERKERLDPDNRPEGAEVDNTEREFDVDRGQFKDADDYDDSEPPPFSDPEDPNKSDDDSDDTPSDDSGENHDDDEDEDEDDKES